jgi:general stress protein 26
MKLLTPEQLLTVTRDAILSAQYCIMTSISESGNPNSRLMQPYEPETDLTIYLGTSPHSRKVGEIQGNQRVNLSYHSSRENAYVSMMGNASIEDNISMRSYYWREEWRVFFPGGPDSDDYTLIKFVPDRIEVMNLARNICRVPYGLRPYILIKENNDWVVSES